MQTTLLGFAIAIILALLAALVGPLLVDWDQYREAFETHASRLTGLEFKVAGAIDARVLPTPSLVLHSVEIGQPGSSGKVRARALRLEFALGSLMRGEWKVADARLEGPEFDLGLDSAGHLALPLPSAGFVPESLTIQQLGIEDGRAILTDAASGSRLVVEKLEFRGEVRSLAGPAKGEGAFVVAGQHYPYRFSASRVGEDGSVKVRLALDPIDRPFAADVDLSISIERGVPRFEGNLTLARPVGRAPEGADAVILEPWRITSHIHGDSGAASLDQIEFQHGPDERPIKLRGSAKLSLGHKLQLDGELSSPQVDLDRILALPEAARRRPAAAVRALADMFSGSMRLPFPVRLGINVETVTLAGAALQRVSGGFRSDGEAWEIEALDFRAPGITQVKLNGHLGVTPAGIGFKGPAKIDSDDPRALLAWLTDRSDAQATLAGPLRMSGGLTLGSEEIGIESLKVELDRVTVAGRFGYRWAGHARPARIDAALTAPEIDVDRLAALGKAVFDGTGFDWPREGQLSLKVARAIVANVEARQTNIDMRIDANGVEIEHLAVADFGGATLAVKGRIDTGGQTPRGAITLDLQARALDGVTALVGTFAPKAAEELRRSSERMIPMTLHASLAVDSAAGGAPNPAAAARFKADGRAGAFRLALQGEARAASRAFTVEGLSMLKAADVKFSGRAETDDGRALVELAGLNRWIAVDQQPGRLLVAVSGPLDGKLSVEGQLLAGSFNLAANGTAKLAEGASPSAALTVKIANANIRSPRPAAPGRPVEGLPATLSARFDLADQTITLTDLTGTIANAGVAGRLVVGLAGPPRLDGELELGALDLPSAIAAVVGMPTMTPDASGLWSAEPFETTLLSSIHGQIKIKSTRAMLSQKLLAHDFRAILRLGESDLALQEIDAEIAGGRLTGDLTAQRRPDGLAASGRIRFTSTSAAELLPGDGVLSGRITLDLMAEGSGRSATALIGSLAGTGTFMLEKGKVQRLDPAVFEALVRAVDAGLPIDAVRVRGWIEKALAGRALPVTLMEGAITIATGQAHLNNVTVHAPTTEISANGSFNLADATIDARLTLAGVNGMAGVANARPELVITLKGPVATPNRTIDVAALSSWLALRSVEQQSKKIEILEGRALPADPGPVGTAPAKPKPAPSTPARVEPEKPRPKSAPAIRPPSAQRPKPAEQARPAPPPINILPFFAPRS